MAVEFEWDNVVIGSTLSALKHSISNQCPIIFNKEPCLFSFRKLSNGQYEHEEWQNTASLLSFKGLNPFADKVSSLKINSDTIDVFCGNKKYAVKYKTIKFFDDENIENFPFDKIEVKNYRVYDWFKVTSGANHPNLMLESDDDFVRKVYFFPKINLPKYKDCVTESFLAEEHLQHVDYTSTMSRLKTIDLMTQNGILGTKHTKTYRYPIKLDFLERQVIEIKKEIIQKKDNYVLDTREFK